MKFTTMVHDLLAAAFSKPATQPFPNPEPDEPERLRGKLHWDCAKCMGCQLCVKDCPSNALKLIVLDKAEKRFVLRYDIGRCTFCAQCVENCRFGCLSMAQDDWALADTEKSLFTILYGNEGNIKDVLENCADDEADSERQTPGDHRRGA